VTSPATRVLILGMNYSPEPTGIAPYTAGLANGLQSRGFSVNVATAYPHYPQWRVVEGYRGLSVRENIDGVPVQRLRHYVPRGRGKVERAVSELVFGARLGLLRWSNPDVVICVSPALVASAVAVARASFSRHKPALGLIMQDLYSAGIEETFGSTSSAWLMSRLEQRVANSVDGVAVIHERLGSRVVARLRVPAERVSVVRNWTHIAPAEPFDRERFRSALGWSEKFVVLHAGAMGEKQALENVVEAARAASGRGLPLHFVLMGDGKRRAALEWQARGCSGIQFLDPLPDREYGRAMRAADALLVNEKPGVLEMALPSKLTSYFSTGVPVIAVTEAASTTAGELAASGAGVQVGAGSPSDLVAAAMELCDDKVRAARLGALGPKYCERVLSEAGAIDRYEQWIRDLLDRANLRRGAQ